MLYKQVELTALERKLNELDSKDYSDNETQWRLGHSIHIEEGAMDEERKALIMEIDEKMRAYGMPRSPCR